MTPDEDAAFIAELRELVRPHLEAHCKVGGDFCYARRETPFPPLARLNVGCDGVLLIARLLDIVTPHSASTEDL